MKSTALPPYHIHHHRALATQWAPYARRAIGPFHKMRVGGLSYTFCNKCKFGLSKTAAA